MAGQVEIITFSDVLTATPTISTSIYASGDMLGTKLAFSKLRPTRTGIVQSVTITDKAKQGAALDIFFFSSDPSLTTFTDNGALTIHDTDLVKILGHVSIAANDYAVFADNSVATKTNAGLILKLDATDTLYACLVSRGTPTYASTSDLFVQVGVLLD